MKGIESARAAGVNPYPHKFGVTSSLPAFVARFAGLAVGEHEEATQLSVAGRVMAKRASGSKLYFYTLVGDGARLQIMADARHAAYDFDALHAATRRGDIVGVRGFAGKSKRGELSVFPVDFVVLTPCLHMLPGHTGLTSQETRYRMRYLDLIMNDDVKAIFRTRTAVVKVRPRRVLREWGVGGVPRRAAERLADGAVARPSPFLFPFWAGDPHVL